MSIPQQPASWYPDPSVPGQLRWWDGTAWTEHVSVPQQTVEQVGPSGTRYATFWERLFAYVIDSLVIGVPLGVLFVIFGADLISDFFQDAIDSAQTAQDAPLAEPDTGPLLRFAFFFGLLGACVSAWYFIWTIGKYGRTLGQNVVGIRVVDSRGEIPGYAVAGKRWLIPGGGQTLGAIPTVGALFSLLVFVDFLSMLWDAQKQCWHDKVAGTWVVRKIELPRRPYS